MGNTQLKHIQVGHGLVARTSNAQTSYAEQSEMIGHRAEMEGGKWIRLVEA
jgi:hypothetical protein